jgi:hypothetical protein
MLDSQWNKSLFSEMNTMFISRNLGEYQSRKSLGNSERSGELTIPSFSGLNRFNIDHTARSISAVIKATTPQ